MQPEDLPPICGYGAARKLFQLLYFGQNPYKLSSGLRSGLLRSPGYRRLRRSGQCNGHKRKRRQVANKTHRDYDDTSLAVCAQVKLARLWTTTA